MRFLRQYGGLRREMYVVFFGRVVTNMGALIWPMLTLILKNKMGMSASEIASLLLLLGCVQLPCMILGGKLADRFPKRNIIIVCDLVTVASYMVCAFLPVSGPMVALMFLAGVFAQMEWPSYDALVADISAPAERERAYSLNYLGANLGIVLAPILGGFLFENHLNLAFAISSAATFSSTVLIFLLIKNTAPAPGEGHAAYHRLVFPAPARHRAPRVGSASDCGGLSDVCVHTGGRPAVFPLHGRFYSGRNIRHAWQPAVYHAAHPGLAPRAGSLHHQHLLGHVFHHQPERRGRPGGRVAHARGVAGGGAAWLFERVRLSCAVQAG